ncbi:hypothetical protein RND81_02G104600 [Saponaria officinalis]|uniref:Protein FAR1-RELATED SEQUENCE n=1 Tax=Saponaria officinalis TaxID=3572 RepID=A0AAW1MLZ1_SAPOF
MLDFDLNEPIIEEDDEPLIGQTFESQEEAYIFYNNYAKRHGFLAVKDRTNTKQGRTIRHDFLCHRAGKQRLKVIDMSKTQRKTRSSKCGCLAHMRITLKRKHNHDMLSLEELRFLPANRNITCEDEKRILMYKEAGLSIRQIIRVLELEKNFKHGDLPFFDRDINNLYGKVKRMLGADDAKNLMEYMKLTKEDNKMFQYAFTLDEERRLENIFWCHARSFEWYQKFGDVVVFYTTYRVNSYDMPWRSNNKVVASMRLVPLNTKSPLEKQAFEVFTSFAFKKFQEEFTRSALYTIDQLDSSDFVVKYFEGDNSRLHKVFWGGNTAVCSCKNFEFWGIICRHILRVFVHRDCFIIPPFYLPQRWHCDAFLATTNVQEVVDNVFTEEEWTIINKEVGDAEDVVFCPSQSKRKGRPRNKRDRGGKEMGMKKTKYCSICKQSGHTKPTCPNKENFFTQNIIDDGVSSTSQKKKQKTAEELGLNPVFTLKI